MTYQTAIEHLKKLTAGEEEFSSTADYFMTHIGEDPLLHHYSQPYSEKDEFFKAILAPVIEYDDQDASIETMMLLSVDNLGFVHGSAFLSNHKLLVLYYFEDIQMGMAFISGLGSDHVNFFRLSAFALDMSTKDKIISISPPSDRRH